MVIVSYALAGLLFGSFATLASHRLIHGGPLVRGRSRCPACEAPLAARDLVPVLSWLWLRGRCRRCGAAIGLRYPLVELVTAVVFALAGWRFGLAPAGLLVAAAGLVLVILAAADLATGLLPDTATLALVPLALAHRWLADDALLLAVLGGALGLGLGWGLRIGAGLVLKRESLGLGDVKLLGAAGLWLPLAAWPAYLVAAGLAGSVLGGLWRLVTGEPEFPFGPALAVALYSIILLPPGALP